MTPETKPEQYVDAEGTPREDLRGADSAYGQTITLLEGDVTDPGLSGEVEALLPADALPRRRGLGARVRNDDGRAQGLRAVRPPAGRKFRIRRDLEIYGITSHPGGFLQRIAP
jgi:hypothetical protein